MDLPAENVLALETDDRQHTESWCRWACGGSTFRAFSQAKPQFSTENSRTYKHTLWGWGTNSICTLYLVCFGWKQERRAQLPLNTGPGSKSNTISLGTECRRGLGVRDWYFRRQRISWFKGAVRREREGQANTEDRHIGEMTEVMGAK